MSDDLAAVVEGFLRARPSWLAENPALYGLLAPPARVHGETLTDHMAAMLAAARAQAEGVLEAGRAAAGLAGRVHASVLALITAPDPGDCVVHALPGLLGLDAAGLCAEAELPGMRRIPPGTVSRLLDGRDVVRRTAPADAPLLHGEAARLAQQDALVRVPWSGPPTLLALASRACAPTDSERGLGALAFLGQAIGAALDRTA